MIRFTPTAWAHGAEAIEQAADDVARHAHTLELDTSLTRLTPHPGLLARLDAAVAQHATALAASATTLARADVEDMIATAKAYAAIEDASADRWTEVQP
ncbi:hypothetical protein [uncultured Tessaracoccus sp.]|uniref:hypothetical protein n=1 Tax=uncultured Tessaracoccus sp. TaxID=905023 RepID=UPI0025DF872F|nr:hypothetical protein [uncultured Tessaracoccus sp.]